MSESISDAAREAIKMRFLCMTCSGTGRHCTECLISLMASFAETCVAFAVAAERKRIHEFICQTHYHEDDLIEFILANEVEGTK